MTTFRERLSGINEQMRQGDRHGADEETTRALCAAMMTLDTQDAARGMAALYRAASPAPTRAVVRLLVRALWELHQQRWEPAS
jgi:hypothetical protein